MKNMQKGFTLIELMIVIAIVAILVALAVPAYQDYTIRAKVGECVNNGAVAKLNISEFRQSEGSFPTSDAQAGLSTIGNTQYCDTMTAYTSATGAFDVLVDETAVDSGISGLIQPVLTPTYSTAGVDWACSSGTTAANNVKYLPSSCRGT